MDDQDIENSLKRYAPTAPPPSLRARILWRAAPPRVWPWAAAASLLFVTTVALEVLTARTAARVKIDARTDSARLAIDGLTEILGGDEVARRDAEAAVSRARRMAARTFAVLSSVDEGSENP